MRARQMLGTMALVGLLGALGCGSEEQLKKVEQELGDLKLEVFKLRRAMEDANQQAEAERAAASESRALDRRFQADLQDTLRQVQDSTRSLNNRVNTLGAQFRTAPKGPTGEAAGPLSEDEKAFGAAVLDYNRGNYALAAESLSLFLAGHATSPRRPDALFFLGLSHYNLKQHDKALEAFDRILKDHASSPQFLPAKLKRAQCLLKMGLKPAAAKAFKEISEGFPGTPEARTAQQELGDLGL